MSKVMIYNNEPSLKIRISDKFLYLSTKCTALPEAVKQGKNDIVISR